MPVNWDDGEDAGLAGRDLESAPSPNAEFGELPAVAAKAKSYQEWRKILLHGCIERNHWKPFTAPASGFFSANESEGEFRIRLQQASESNAINSLRDFERNMLPKSQRSRKECGGQSRLCPRV